MATATKTTQQKVGTAADVRNLHPNTWAAVRAHQATVRRQQKVSTYGRLIEELKGQEDKESRNLVNIYQRIAERREAALKESQKEEQAAVKAVPKTERPTFEKMAAVLDEHFGVA